MLAESSPGSAARRRGRLRLWLGRHGPDCQRAYNEAMRDTRRVEDEVVELRRVVGQARWALSRVDHPPVTVPPDHRCICGADPLDPCHWPPVDERRHA